MFTLIACGDPVATLDPVTGTLGPCPSTPNCVSSLADPSDEVHHVAPFQVAPGDPAGARDAMAAALGAMDGVTVLETRDLIDHDDVLAAWLHAEFVTLARFRDDVEILVLPDGTAHVRSASRVGYGDTGTNRRRVASLREVLSLREAAAGR